MEARLFSCVILSLLISVVSFSQNSDPFPALRNQMVKTQIEARGITDKNVLEAFRKVERHKFVLTQYIPYAYSDSPLPIDEGQTISQPYIVAFMTDALNLKRTDKVLEIGTGSGYQAAILAELCDSVFTIEIFEKLGHKARRVFSELGYNNIFSKIDDGYQGWQEYAPFDAIIVTCAPTEVPEPLQKQLAEGGRLIIPVGTNPLQHLILQKKKNGKLREKNILPVRFVPMIDSSGKKY
ncbi:protein-L-isoaspartate(D-aspartate) O-methyltransferase [Mariniphaga anaerophila]|uniref:Protein-L-isoaspartate O-methyltransferase n=1 Tax=Mariniphaga anaerophila TaxID=1484053 RepID=A0A1M5D0F1_9BACT|nr:protein-L-isoaspartate(D-aspartate) O-methyltransferase [Mariniphaga anaerophila]SHF60493.1 protein-L-isoaspartate(D-aspartate) O-methyltransferase [Mariniphaga anaerophila]